MESWPRRHRITVDEYYRMAEVGLLAPDARVELVEGEIIDMAPMGPRHSSIVAELLRLFVSAVGDRAIVRCQDAVRLDRSSEPQPDIAILAPRNHRYRRAHPAPSDVLLVVEVSDTTLRYDADVKSPLYAIHGIPESWIVDLRDGELRVHRKPEGGRYVEQAVIKAPGVMPLAALPGIEVDLSGILDR